MKKFHAIVLLIVLTTAWAVISQALTWFAGDKFSGMHPLPALGLLALLALVGWTSLGRLFAVAREESRVNPW